MEIMYILIRWFLKKPADLDPHCLQKSLYLFWCVSVDTTVLHTFLSAPACTNIVQSKELERDVTATAMAKALLRLKTLAPSFIEHDRFDFFTSEGNLRAVMYMPCVKCSCYELKLANICILSSF